jgi:hypothetical protein
MTDTQKHAVRCAYLDLVGAYEANQESYNYAHDWDAHLQSIDDLEELFPDLLTDLIKENLT